MPRIIWFSQPSNHSGYLNLLYLTPDGDVGRESTYTDMLTGYFIMGGPALIEDYNDITDAGAKLLSRLGKGFHFYPSGSEASIRKNVEDHRSSVTEKLEEASWEFDNLSVFSEALSDYECLSMLLRGDEPDSPVALVDRSDSSEGDGLDVLCEELARIFYRMPGGERQALNLKRDWNIPGD